MASIEREGDGGTTAERLAKLSPSQRALLERRLMERRMETARLSTIPPRTTDGPAPLSHAQELLWLLSQVFDDGIAYNSPGAFQLIGPLDLELLGRALNGLLERHSILRTTYTVVGDRPVQIIGESEPLDDQLRRPEGDGSRPAGGGVAADPA